jgi:starch-binding outer membrane protein, SusD/RagB family
MERITDNNRGIARILGILFFSILFFAGLSSCNDDFLDKAPLDKISDQAVWDDISLMEAYVIQTYRFMQAPHSNHYHLSTITDESYARERTPAHLIQRGELTPSNLGRLGYVWGNYYRIITRANIFLSNAMERDYSDRSPSEQEKLNMMIGEMHFHRGYSYYRLASFVGGVPLVTTPFSLDDDYLISRESYENVMSFAIAELDEAARLLPVAQPANMAGRATKGAALGIKARALLYYASPLNNPNNDMSRWQAAADAAKAVIDMGIYSLYPDYGELFREEANFNNNEYIFEMVINNSLVRIMGIERDFYPNGHGGFAVCVPTHQQVQAYETANGMYIEDDPDYDPDRFWENRDPRFYATILWNGVQFRGREIELFLPGGMDSFEGPIGSWNASYTGYYNRKFIQEWLEGAPGGSSGNTSSPNFPRLRYAEVLLNYAEALYNLDQEDLARQYINMVRSRPSVNMPPVADSGPALMRRIENERRVELYLEEHRFFDIRRWKKTYPADFALQKMNYQKDLETGEIEYSLTDVIAFRLPEYTYRIPIPIDEITRNPNLEQNPGY